MVTERKRKEITITCPGCGYEYLPAEVYYPNHFFGNPTDIDRSPDGKVDIYDGQSMNLVENFTCDHCGITFEVSADIKFKTKAVEDDPFSTVYTSKIYPEKITLAEDDCN